MAAQVRFSPSMKDRYFTIDSVIFYPATLMAHFKKNAVLEIQPGNSFYVWLKGESLEWENDDAKKMQQIQEIFNRILQPIGKSIRKISSESSVKLETFNDGFSILPLNQTLVIKVQ